MSENEGKEKRCVICGKKLMDEKIPVCLRCKLKGRKVFAGVAGVAIVISKTKAAVDNSKKNL